MDAEFLTRHWGLVVAVTLLLAVSVVVASSILQQSRSGQLRAHLRTVRTTRRKRQSAARELASREQRLERLEGRAEHVEPRRIDELRGLRDDARSLVRIATDQRMIAENRLRIFIYEEFPPNRHDDLRRRYLPDDVEDGCPSSS